MCIPLTNFDREFLARLRIVNLHGGMFLSETRNLDLRFRPRAIFTTAEKLLEGQRRDDRGGFPYKSFNNYGLNDGGVSAYECEALRNAY